MGFYSPAVLVKNAQRHGLRVKPMDVQVSEWACTIEHGDNGALSLRLGLRYAKGMREVSARALIESRRKDGLFQASEDLALRVRSLNRKELPFLACIGALNHLDRITHRRDALWQVERAGKLEEPLLRQ
jgi:error-prone DNA polymerase